MSASRSEKPSDTIWLFNTSLKIKTRLFVMGVTRPHRYPIISIWVEGWVFFFFLFSGKGKGWKNGSCVDPREQRRGRKNRWAEVSARDISINLPAGDDYYALQWVCFGRFFWHGQPLTSVLWIFLESSTFGWVSYWRTFGTLILGVTGYLETFANRSIIEN